MRGEIAESTRFEGHANDGCFTINGDRNRDGIADVTLSGKNEYWDSSGHLEILRVSCSDVHINGINFSQYSDFTVYKRFNQAKSYFDIKNISLTGCSFEALCNGTGRCFLNFYSQYGHGASGYGQFGAYDLDGFTMSGSTFNGEALAAIMATGDSDYIRTRNITFQGNKIYNGMIFVRNTDANTWYMWGQNEPYGSENGEGTTIGVCDYNTMENVTISGNRLEFDEDAPYNPNFDGNYGQILHVGNANSGASHNVTRNVIFRCNTSRIHQNCVDTHEFRPQASIKIDNAGLGDRGVEMHFDDELMCSLCETSDNLMEGLRICYNDLELLRFDIACTSYMYGGAPGTGNVLRDVTIDHNTVSSVNGLRISAADSESGTAYASDGTIEGLTIEDNVFTARRKSGWNADTDSDALEYSSGEKTDFGIRIFASQVCTYSLGEVSNYDNPGVEEPLDNIQAQILSVAIHNNTVAGFANGIGIAAADSERTHYAYDAHVSDVDISGNVITTDAVNRNCRGDGIMVAGAIDGGVDCSVDMISISENMITAANGVVATGFYLLGQCCRYGASGNQVHGLSVNDNFFAYQDPAGYGGFPILAADAMSAWDEIPRALGESRVRLEASGNIAAGFTWDEWLPSEYSEESVLPSRVEARIAELQAYTDTVLGEYSVQWDIAADESGTWYTLDGPADREPYIRPGWRHIFYSCLYAEAADYLELTKTADAATAEYAFLDGAAVLVAAFDASGMMLGIWFADPSLESFTAHLPEGTAKVEAYLVTAGFAPVLTRILP